VTGFDVSIYAIRRRPGRRREFEVRWRAAGRVRSRSFLTRVLADSYRAELVRAGRTGLEFNPATGEPAAWNQPEPVTVTWYEYAAVRWPELAAHSRSSLADALATITPALTRQDTRTRGSCAPRCTGTHSTQRAPHPPGAKQNRSWTGQAGPRCRSPGSCFWLGLPLWTGAIRSLKRRMGARLPLPSGVIRAGSRCLHCMGRPAAAWTVTPMLGLSAQPESG